MILPVTTGWRMHIACSGRISTALQNAYNEPRRGVGMFAVVTLHR